MKTKRQLLIDAFTAMGCKSAILRTKKYVGFEMDLDRRPYVYLIGKSAALRVVPEGQPVANAGSISGGRLYAALLVVGSRLGCYSSTDQAKADLAHEFGRKI